MSVAARWSRWVVRGCDKSKRLWHINGEGPNNRRASSAFRVLGVSLRRAFAPVPANAAQIHFEAPRPGQPIIRCITKDVAPDRALAAILTD